MKSHKARTNPARLVDHQDENNERVRWLTPAEKNDLRQLLQGDAWNNCLLS
jgi:hypothetical protein